MKAEGPAVSPAEGGDNEGAGSIGGLSNAVEWSVVKAEARGIYRSAPDRKRVWERMKLRAEELFSRNQGEIGVDLVGSTPGEYKGIKAIPSVILQGARGMEMAWPLEDKERVGRQVRVICSLLRLRFVYRILVRK